MTTAKVVFSLSYCITDLNTGPLGDGADVGVLNEQYVQGGQHHRQRQHLVN
jgi:hypothetical protein